MGDEYDISLGPVPGSTSSSGSASSGVENSTSSTEDGLVWFENGQERPFEDASTSIRPWLEMSVDWNAPGGDDDSDADKASGDDPDSGGLLWV